MGFIGADPEQLQAFAGVLVSGATTLEGARSRINGLVHTAGWEGPEADAFRSAWAAKYSPIMDAAAKVLSSTATQVRFEAQQQVAASSDTGGARFGSSASAARSATPPRVHASLWTRGWGYYEGAWRTEVKGFDGAVHEAGRIQHDVVESRVFRDVVTVARVAGTVASVVAPFVPVLAPVALGLDGLVTLGDVAEMANHVEPWNAGKLVGDGLNTVFAGAGALKLIGQGAGLVDDTVAGANRLQELVPAISDDGAVLGSTALNVGSEIDSSWSVADGSVNCVKDVDTGNYRRLPNDALDVLSGAEGLE